MAGAASGTLVMPTRGVGRGVGVGKSEEMGPFPVAQPARSKSATARPSQRNVFIQFLSSTAKFISPLQAT